MGVQIGDKFGRLIVIDKINADDRKGCICQCACGTIKKIAGGNLTNGSIISCGCAKRERFAILGRAKTKYGGISKIPEWRWLWQTWRDMKHRCLYPDNAGYKNYGARGIRICHYLQEDPRNLVELLGTKPLPKHTLDRIDNDGHYSCGRCQECREKGWPLNIRWATGRQQSENKRDNHKLTAFGKIMILARWAEETGIDAGMIRWRIKHGWTAEEALSTPTKYGNRVHHRYKKRCS